MQDIVPKGKSIRNVTRGEEPRAEAREPKKPERAERIKITREEKRETKVREEKPKKEFIIDREESETVVEVPPEEVARREALREAREEFEARRARQEKRAKRPSKSRGPGLGAFWANNSKALIIVGSIVAVIGLAGILSGAFKSALITVTPRTLAFTADADIVAKKNPAAGELPYQLVTLQLSGSQTVRASGQKQVSTRASGTIVIYNNYSSAPQRLIKNTRFATPEGLIFRISDSVTVPGKRGDAPGSVEATVMADEAGANYNVGLKDFTIPGFKGDPRYAAFYARSKTPLAGGFVGIQKIVADADRAKAKSDIEAKLRDELVRQVTAKVPADQVMYEKAYSIEYMALPDEAISSSEASIKENGIIYAVTFDRKVLASALATAYIKDYKGDAVTVPLLSSLSFAPKDFKPSSADAVSFHLSGPAKFEWSYDEAALKAALKGQPRSSTPVVLRKFPMIEKADISLRPFWARAFPSSVDKITVKKAI